MRVFNDRLTTSSGDDNPPISGRIGIFKAPIFVKAANKKPQIEDDEDDHKSEKLGVVSDIRH